MNDCVGSVSSNELINTIHKLIDKYGGVNVVVDQIESEWAKHHTVFRQDMENYNPKRWTREEDNRMIKFKKDGLSSGQIAIKLNRSKQSVRNHIKYLRNKLMLTDIPVWQK